MLQFNPHHLHIIRERQKLRAQSEEEREHKSNHKDTQFNIILLELQTFLFFFHLGCIHYFLQILGLIDLFSALIFIPWSSAKCRTEQWRCKYCCLFGFSLSVRLSVWAGFPDNDPDTLYAQVTVISLSARWKLPW